jgi:peptidoglycan/LPS O-acetylase OafA/YrhL
VPTELLVAEYVGMALVVAAALVETISIGPMRGLVPVAAGVLLAGWGELTRVRRRVWFGAATVVVAAILMLAGPIAKLVPEVRGPALWGLLAAAGLVLIVAATMLERGRERLTTFVRRLDDLMEGWE